MTFDAWIAKILGSLSDESGALGAKRTRRNRNPVEVRELRPEDLAQLQSPQPASRVAQMIQHQPTAQVAEAPKPAEPRLPERFAKAAAARAMHDQQKRTGTKTHLKTMLLHTTATGAVRFARTSDAEIARLKVEQERLEAEARAHAEAVATERAEKERRRPTWVRYSRTPDTARKQQAPVDAPVASIEASVSEQQIANSNPAGAPGFETDAAIGSEVSDVADLVNQLNADHALTPRPCVEILIPRSRNMARTDVFLGDAASRVTIEEYDSPDLHRAPVVRRRHPQEKPLVRSEIERLARLLEDAATETASANEAKRLAALRMPAPQRQPESEVGRAPNAPEPAAADNSRMRVRVKAGSQPTPQAQPVKPAKRIAVRAKRVADFEFPALDLLHEHEESCFADTAPEHLEHTARLLEGVLEDFGVKGEIVNVRPGPVVTLYELEPAPGVKSSRVIGLADDIARSMSAISARVAVVQGRNAIGIELPNHDRETVYLRELLASADFEGSKHRLAIALGKTIGGEPVIVDLARMPHLLVAGTTGSGKSVAINTMILSVLYRLEPAQCRLIMVDPKMLELSVYDGIPHLLTPVVTDPKKAVVALKWAVREMEDRYKKMSKVGVRNIDGFNARVAEAQAKGETISRTVQTGFDRETGEAIYEQEEMELSALPYIIVVVDEMADLMMVAGKDIEGAIQRLAQMARAAGIHLIMATQRPSVDVITGTIKANFPTRISFQVTSKIDSRTILGEQGAEQLLGQGDMLYMAGGGRISRVHGPFVSDAEVEKVVAHLKSQGAPDYLDAITVDEDEETGGDAGAAGGDFGSDEGADLYDRAVNIVLRDRKCSVSYIQRRLSVGYNKAASLVERMEKEGVVGQANHSGKREILVGGGVDRGAYDMRDD